MERLATAAPLLWAAFYSKIVSPAGMAGRGSALESFHKVPPPPFGIAGQMLGGLRAGPGIGGTFEG